MNPARGGMSPGKPGESSAKTPLSPGMTGKSSVHWESTVKRQFRLATKAQSHEDRNECRSASIQDHLTRKVK